MLAARTEGEAVTNAGAGLLQVKARIDVAARRAGRDPKSITLIAVSKTFGASAIEPVIEAGQRDFGENRVQEALKKWPLLKEKHPGLRLHLIGPLQTNKARDAVSHFDAVHSVDRDKLAAALATEMHSQGRALSLFVQVNTGKEAQKSGVVPDEAAAFVRRCRDEHGLAIEGLMCIPPIEDDPIPHFELLRRLAEESRVKSLSMGMSADFETAIEHGATHVRVGSAIFGARG
jgi:pyridoxal phosphate enzyme (YggS family)